MQHFLLFLRGDRLVRGDETRGQKRIVRKIAIDQEPPARSLRQRVTPVGQGGGGIGCVLQLVEQDKGGFECFATEPLGGEGGLKRFSGGVKIRGLQFLAVALQSCWREASAAGVEKPLIVPAACNALQRGSLFANNRAAAAGPLL